MRATALVVAISGALLALGERSAPAWAAGDTPPPCVLTPIAPLNVLISKARVATVRVATSTAACRTALAARGRLKLTSGNVALIATPAALADALELRIDDVSVDVGTHDWTVTSLDDKPLGTVTMSLPVVALETISLVVSFRADTDSRRQVERKAPDLVAAARRSAAWDKTETVSGPIVTNAAIVAVPTGLLHRGDLAWRIEESTWGDSVAFLCKDATGLDLTRVERARTPCQVSPDRVMFSVQRKLASPLVARLALVDKANSSRPLLSIDLTLASKAQTESLPLALWRIARVACINERLIGSDYVAEALPSKPMPIDNDAVTRGACFLRFDTSYRPVFHPKASDDDARAAITASNTISCNAWKESVALAGPQHIQIAVKRGATSIVQDLTLDPDPVICKEVEVAYGSRTKRSVALEVPLRAPKDSASLDGPYSIELRLKGTPEVHYFDGSLDETALDSNVDAQADFMLRPRGPMSTTYPVRFAFTLAVTPVALRFPTRAADVTSSSTPTNIHLESPRTALMAQLEYWDYSRGENKLPLPIQLQAGLSFLKFTKDPIEINFLAGATLAAPLFGAGATESTLSVGVFYEHEFMGTHSNALLITGSLDLFKLLKTNEP